MIDEPVIYSDLFAYAYPAVGVNSRAQLSVASKIMQHRIQQELMEHGVTIVAPENTWIDARAKIGQDTVIEPFTVIRRGVKIGSHCEVGPFCQLRAGAVLEDHAEVGNFVEAKRTRLRARAKAASSVLGAFCSASSTDWYSAVGMFLRLASSCVRESTVLELVGLAIFMLSRWPPVCRRLRLFCSRFRCRESAACRLR